MEGPQTALVDRRDTEPYMKLLPDKDLYKCGTRSDESNYVDLDNLLDMKSEAAKTLKVMFTGESDHLAIFKCGGDGSTSGDKSLSECELNLANLHVKDRECNSKERSGDATTETCDAGDLSFDSVSPFEVPDSNDDFRDSPVYPDAVPGSQTDLVPLNYDYKSKGVSSKREKLQYTDVHLTEKGESEDCTSVVLSSRGASSSPEDESHFITTHEIQLTELDHDVDCDFELESRCDIEEDNLVYSFVDYASFDSDETIGGDIDDDSSLAPVNSDQALSDNSAPCPASAPATSAKRDAADKGCSSDESALKAFQGGNESSQIRLSIKATSRAINKSVNVEETESVGRPSAKQEGDWRRYVYKGKEAKCDRARCFIPAPGRVHFGKKLRKDFEYSSGASSSVSELDDADKEVRNFTARAFKSLACPYFDALNLSASTESSASELSIDGWSAFVDLKCGHVTQAGAARKQIALKGLTSHVEVNKNADTRGIKGPAGPKPNPAQATAASAIDSSPSNPPKPSSKKIELIGRLGQGQKGLITLTETPNVQRDPNAGVAVSERRARFAEKTAGSRSVDEVPGAPTKQQSAERSSPPCEPKKAMLASSLLKNVISKKMQFEHERKMERCEVREDRLEREIDDARSGIRGRGQGSGVAVESQGSGVVGQGSGVVVEGQGSGVGGQGSGDGDPGGVQDPIEDPQEQHTVVSDDIGSGAGVQGQVSGACITSVEEPRETVSGNSQEKSKNESESETTVTCASETNSVSKNEVRRDDSEAGRHALLPSQNSAFRSWKNGDADPKEKALLSTGGPGEINIDLTVGDSKFTKMSRLFVSSVQSKAKEPEPEKRALGDDNTTCASADRGEGGVGAMPAGPPRSPEIKISLRSVKGGEVKPFNIASLLTPSIGFNAASLVKAGDTTRSRALIASLKGDWAGRMPPQFMVRDIRDNKYKLLTPIHQVRDVRKLVKSTYHFVSLDNRESKTVSDAPRQGPERRNMALFSPMVIKCQSVNTNGRPDVRRAGHSIRGPSPPRTADGARDGVAPGPRTPSRTPAVPARRPSADAPPEMPAGTNGPKPEAASENGERRLPSNMAERAAREKLQAAVRTMEELYVFNRNEWRRKINAPRPVTDSHVLSLIASEERGGTGSLGNDSNPSAERPPTAEPKKEGSALVRSVHGPGSREGRRAHEAASEQNGVFSTAFTLAGSQKASPGSHTPSSKVLHPSLTGANGFAPRAVKMPLSLKISHGAGGERHMSHSVEAQAQPGTDSEGGYLDVPDKGRTGESKAAAPAAPPSSPPGARLPLPHPPPSMRFPVAVETQSPDSSAIRYRCQPQVVCFPQAPPFAGTPCADPAQMTQKKMLLDPTTGQCYLVDTPVVPAARKLFDPETGRYADVPAPPLPDTPVPLPLSPLAATLTPSPYAATPTYVIYPGYLPSPARTLRSAHSSDANKNVGGGEVRLGRRPLPSQHVATRGRTDNKPVISITSQQQGPRIIAPPSFDGTTMSFVVEHR